MLRDDLRRELEELERLEKTATQAFDVWETDPSNENLATIVDETYCEEFRQFEKFVHMISGAGIGIDVLTARKMVKNPPLREKLKLITGITA